MTCNLCESTEQNYGTLFKDKPEMFYTPGIDYCPSCWHPFISQKDPYYIKYLTKSGQKHISNKKINKKCILEIHIFLVKKKVYSNPVYYSDGNKIIDS